MWISIYERYAEDTSAPKVLYLDRPVSMCSSEEIEHAVLRFESTLFNVVMTRQNPEPMRHAYAPHVHSRVLIRGGRWLLYTTENEQVTYIDFEANPSEVKEEVLIPNQRQSSYIGPPVIESVDMDEDSTILSFNLALKLISERFSDSRDEGYVIQIWKVDLVIKDNRGIGLQAKCIKSINFTSQIHSISLLGPHIAMVQSPARYNEVHMVIIDWRKVEEGLPHYPRRVIEPNTGYYGVSMVHLISFSGNDY